MTPKPQRFLVDTRPSKAVVVDSLIRDISIDACIFDLIDNSIDAARDTIYKLDKNLDREKPPASYEGFKIEIKTDGAQFVITDNCGGITQQDLANSVLRFGQRSSHKSGIGVFGVGLNRAIFKLGTVVNIESDTGREKCTLTLNTQDYIKDENNWDLPAQKYRSGKTVGTSITISGLPSETSRVLADKIWQQAFSIETGRRYGKLIEKGLEIKLNSERIESRLIQLRPNSPYGKETKFFKLSDNVTVYIEAGQHSKHKFSAEPDYDKDANRPLTPEFGWTIFCNERAVIVSDQTWKTGWSGKFHTQFYGFVGNVYFSSSDPEKLPWSTTKTDVDLNNPAYQTTLKEMEKFVQIWRSNSDDAKIKKRDKEPLTPPPSPAASQAKPTMPTETGTSKPGAKGDNSGSKQAPQGPTKKPVTRVDHNTLETILPQDINELNCNDKHLALVHEAKKLNLNNLSYSGLVLIRILFEVSSVQYLIRQGTYNNLRTILIEKRNKEREKTERIPLTKAEEKNISPTLDEVISFFESHEDVWDATISKNIKTSLKKFAKYKEKLNSAVHNPFQLISKYEAFAIRDEVLPILRHLIEK